MGDDAPPPISRDATRKSSRLSTSSGISSTATRGYPGLPERFARLQIVADAVDFLKDRTDPHAPR